MDLKHLEKQAICLLKEACCSYGILASPLDKENYRRLWSRDSMIAGVAGLLAPDEEVLEGFRNSILTLARYQHPRGMIPSNLLPDPAGAEVSYGGLAGRVDATTWFVVGTCLYLLNQPDEELKQTLHSHLLQALDTLDGWEFNGKGLLYTPLSGNWTDEYPIEGHTFYDNLLRLWALRLYARLYEDEERAEQVRFIKEKISVNFWPEPDKENHPAVYHRREFIEEANKELSHFACSIDPTGYNMHFDTAAHGLALLLGLASENQTERIRLHAEQIFKEVGVSMTPAFWPVITPDDDKWHAISKNYTFYFKNNPHHFHNGGIWPVWVGLLGLGFSRSGKPPVAEKMLQSWIYTEQPGPISFCEYIASDSLKCSGKKRLSFSASGLIFLVSAFNNNFNQTLYLNP